MKSTLPAIAPGTSVAIEELNCAAGPSAIVTADAARFMERLVVANNLVGSAAGEAVRHTIRSTFEEASEPYREIASPLVCDPSGDGGDCVAWKFDDPAVPDAMDLANAIHVRSEDRRSGYGTNDPIKYRIAIVLLEPELDWPMSLYRGMAARLQSACEPGCTLVSAAYFWALSPRARARFKRRPIEVSGKPGEPPIMAHMSVSRPAPLADFQPIPDEQVPIGDAGRAYRWYLKYVHDGC